MNAGDWITLAAVIVALGIGVASILQTQRLQKQQYHEDILRKIMNWLMDVSEGAARYNLANVSEAQIALASAENAKLYFSISELNLSNEYTRLGNMGNLLVSYFRNQKAPLPKEIIKLIKVLEKLAKAHEEYRKSFIDLPNKLEEVNTLANKRNETERIADESLLEHQRKIAAMVYKLRYAKTLL